jgi:predicted metallo-beta-lactamase superfamily hydrolase
VILEAEFEQELENVERIFVDVKERYRQIKHDKQRQLELGHRFEEIRRSQKTSSEELKKELKDIQEQLEALDNALGLFSESYLVLFGGSIIFKRSGLKDVFWQIARFGGLGVIIGWILKSCTG